MYQYEITLLLYTYDWSVEPAKKIEVKKSFVCESWDTAKDLIGLMADSTSSLSLEITKKEVKA
jgi:hypothetical protein